MQKYHFISGLPRSGSTLLSSILKQNPRFHAAISDPLYDYVRNMLQVTHQSVGMEAAVPVSKRTELIRGLFGLFYQNKPEICFNTNRSWTSTTALIKDLFPNSKILICIRDIPWILDSFEQLNSKNPYTIKALYHHRDLLTVYERTHTLMGNEGGYVQGPLVALRQALYSNEKNMLCVIDYEAISKNPLSTMKRIYEFLGEPWFEHDFNDVEDSYDEFDAQTNIAGLHRIRKKVEFTQRRPIIPEDLWLQYSQSSFWKMEFDHIKSQILWIE
jgi:sulfotransferase